MYRIGWQDGPTVPHFIQWWLAYEIAVDARYGQALWDALMSAGEAHGIAPYGLEALNVMRIEKGHVTHAELDGRVSIADTGLGKMASTKKISLVAYPQPVLLILKKDANSWLASARLDRRHTV